MNKKELKAAEHEAAITRLYCDRHIEIDDAVDWIYAIRSLPKFEKALMLLSAANVVSWVLYALVHILR